jgi:hypothetical protein
VSSCENGANLPDRGAISVRILLRCLAEPDNNGERRFRAYCSDRFQAGVTAPAPHIFEMLWNGSGCFQVAFLAIEQGWNDLWECSGPKSGPNRYANW